MLKNKKKNKKMLKLLKNSKKNLKIFRKFCNYYFFQTLDRFYE